MDKSTATEALETARTLARSGFLAPLRPDKYVRMGLAVRAQGMSTATGIVLAARRAPHAIGLVDERGALTWAELDAQCDALAAAFAALPGGAPESIALLARNSRGFVLTLAAASKIGADILLLNTGFSGPQLAGVLEREGGDLLVLDQEFLALTDSFEACPPKYLSWQDEPSDLPTIDRLVAQHRGQRPGPATRQGRTLLLTSGTTGAPKGARRGGGGSVANLTAVLERVPWRADGMTVCAAPMFHAWGFGILVISATMTSGIVMRRHFEPQAILELAARHRANGLGVVPVMLERMGGLPPEILSQYDLSALEFVTASGSAVNPRSVLAFMDAVGDLVYNNYNATEAGMIAIATPADLRAAPTTAGRPVTGCDVRIVGPDGAVLPTGEVGSITVSSDTRFDGYTGSDAPTEEYMRTGDVGRLDENGRLFVEGRDDEMIVSGGENVYPREVETCLSEYPAVEDVAVIGVEDEAFGQRLEAFVTLMAGASATEDELKAYVRDRLARYKVPRSVLVMDELPRTTTGKVIKRELPVSKAK